MDKKDELVRINTEDMGSRVKEFLEILSKRVKGQDMAIRDVAEAYECYISGLKRKDGPIFVGLFLGPSGVGKTLVGEVLAEHLFGHRGAFCKIKCETFVSEHQIASLIGAPPGYVGHQDPNDEQRFNEESPHPMLSQWNLDKHDAERIKKEGMAERNKFLERKKKYDASSEDIDKLGEEVKKLREEALKLEKEMTALEKLQATTPKNKQWKIASAVNKLRARLVTLKSKETEALTKLSEAAKHRAEEKVFLQKWYKSMAERGIIYDSEVPYPYTSIVLFDEIEKADPAIHRMLFDIMDKGELQLANGRTTSFRNSFIFMTGNVGEKEISDIQSGNANIGFRQNVAEAETEDKKIYEAAVDAAKKTFPTAFFGRLDKIVVFRPLKFETMLEILDVHIAELHLDFLEAEKPLLIELEDSLKKFLVEQSIGDGRNAYGARNLKARLKKFITNKLVRAIGNGSLKPPAEVFAKLEEVNGKKKVVFDSTIMKFPEDKPEVKKNKTNP